MKTIEPRVLIVDDTPERHTLLPNGGVRFEVLHPLDVNASSLEDVDLVCVDEYLGSEWASAIQQQVGNLPALQNADGIAVAAALRSRARLADRAGELGFAVALFTAELDKLSENIPRARQEQLTASLHDLEWVFRFEQGPSDFGSRVEELAYASQSITRIDVSDQGDQWLVLPEQPWANLARAQIDDCRPPQSSLARSTSGRSYLRWFAQRILPYPTFLVDDVYAAHSLGIDTASFSVQPLQRLLESYYARYRGPLSEKFLGRRWWRAALREVMTEVGSSLWAEPREKAKALSSAVGLRMKPLNAVNPVVCYRPDGEIDTVDAEASNCVRVQFDGWPLYADEAWVRLDVARADPAVRSLIAHDDLSRLSN